MITAKLDTRLVKKELRDLQKKASRPQKLLNEIGESEIKQVQTRVRTKKTDPDGQKWQGWSPYTKAARAKQGRSESANLLYLSGLLYSSFWHKVSRAMLTISNSAPYFKFHQNGGKSYNKPPQRQILGWGKEATKNAERNVVRYFKK